VSHEDPPVSDATLRTFVAVLLPDRVRAGLAAVSAELRGQTRGLTWVPEDNLHLTLRFLGEIEPATLDRVQGAVVAAAAAVAPFTVNLGGLGGFPAGRAPRVLWASVSTGGEGIEALFGGLEAELVARGIPGETRAFHPHVTLARARDPRGAKELLSVLGAGPAFGEVRVEALHLMRSELSPRGARYSALTTAPLGSPLGPA
jgi:RNA 2',3'-cyclic 3'-phosphodiesterase